MLYELRIYDAMPGRFGAVNDRLANYSSPFLRKHGMEILGFWTDEIGTSNRVTYIISFESMADCEAKWSAFRADPDWQRAFAETEKDGPLVGTVHNSFMRLTPYSPEPQVTSKVQELRVYEVVPGKMQALHERMANHTMGYLKKYGIDMIGFWTDAVGISNQLWWMIGYPSLAEREKRWSAFMVDPDWLKAVEESHRDGVLVSRAHNSILSPTPYSPRG